MQRRGREQAAYRKLSAKLRSAIEEGRFGDGERLPTEAELATGIEPPKSNWANPIETPPFYGFPMTANLTFTYGGIKTDTQARVLSTNGVPIPGLYAAGEMTGLFYHEYPPAPSVLRSLTFGRIAGTNVAKTLSGTAAATG